MITLGILLHQLDDSLAKAVMQGLRAKAHQHRMRLVYLPAKHLHSPKQFNRQFNILFDIAAQLPFDGILSITNSFQAGAYDEEIIQLFERFQPIPLLSCNFIADNVPAVAMDNLMGSEQLFAHLLDDHKYTRIAYMRGPDGHYDEQERFDTYLAALRNRDIAYDPALVVQGHFDSASGRRAMAALLERRVSFDALVCANDEMALAAMSFATDQHLHIPGDFAICGFDNLRSISGEALPMTSVSQPVETQIQLSIENLLAHIKGHSIPLCTKVPTKLVVRHSCGCSGVRDVNKSWSPKGISYKRAFNQLYREKIIASLHLAPHREPIYKSYLLFLEHCIKQVDKNTWMDSAIGEFALECLIQDGEVTALQSLVLRLQQSLFDIVPDLLGGANQLHLLGCATQMQKWQIAITNKAHQYFLAQQDTRTRNREYFRDWEKSRPEVSSSDAAKSHIEKLLRHFGIKNAYIGQYLTKVDYQLFGIDMPSDLQQWFAIQDGFVKDNTLEDLLPLKHLLKVMDTTSQQGSEWVVFPLFNHHTHFGVLVMCLDDSIPVPIEWLRSEFSRLMINAIMNEELHTQGARQQGVLENPAISNERLIHLSERDELTGLLNRRGFFHRAPSWIASQGEGDRIALFIDLDNFKTITDEFGHAESEQALMDAASIITLAFRNEDLICRLGSDEFVVLTCGSSNRPPQGLQERLYKHFDSHNESSNKPYNLSCSLGYISFSMEDATNLERLLEQVDTLLFEEKRRRKAARLMH